jgi:hypothetical protein
LQTMHSPPLSTGTGGVDWPTAPPPWRGGGGLWASHSS